MTARSRTLLVLEALAGAGLMLEPAAFVRCGGVSTQRAERVARVLGARQLLQAALLARSGATPRGLRLAAAVDGAHAASMVVLAWGRPQARPAALLSAGAAAGLCGWELATAHSSRTPR